MADSSVDKRGSLLSAPLIGQSGDNQGDLSVDISRNGENETKTNENLWLGFNDMRLSITDSKTKEAKFILDGISGQCYGGQVYGIIGASGGGKTTLLGVLSGRIQFLESLATKCRISGEVQLNNNLMDCSRDRNLEYLRRSIAFVLQEDILLPTELAREAIEISALLRLPHSKFSKEDKIRKAREILEALDLLKCSETMIGGQAVRGLSGGERKRVSIGIELVTDPNILMLDEPTSGLDSAIAYQTMLLLRRLANSGKMVIASIHQPSSEIFNTLDRVLILARGKAVYEGKVSNLPGYLISIGYECPRYSNIADYVLQKVSENTEFFIDKWDEHMRENQDSSFSNVKRKMNQQTTKQIGDDDNDLSKQEMAPFCFMITALVKRQFSIFIRDKVPTVIRFAQAIFTAVLQGLLWFRLKDLDKDPTVTNVQNRFGGIFYATTFAAMNAIMVANLTFPSQRLVFQKERLSNWYYTTLWIFAKSLIDLPITFLVILPYSVIIKFMCNFNAAFYEIFLILSLVALVADSMGFCLGCIAKRPEIAQQLTPVTIIPLFLFSNFFVSNKTIPIWIRWIQYIDCFFYGTRALCIWEFRGQNDIADEYLQIDLKADIWIDIYALLALFVGFRIIAIAKLISSNGI